MSTQEVPEKARVTYAPASIETHVLDELRQTAFEMTGKFGRRVTLSEALHILIERYNEDWFSGSRKTRSAAIPDS
jgi:hypothetical protein